jgi:hypothetical protein
LDSGERLAEHVRATDDAFKTESPGLLSLKISAGAPPLKRSRYIHVVMTFRQPRPDEDNKVNTLCIHLDARFETPCLWPPFHATFLARFFYVLTLTFVAWFPKKVMAYALLC